MNPWHDIDPHQKSDDTLDCVIEIPRGGRLKYELDKATGLLRLDRVLWSAVFYPANYGFIPQTYCDDKDPLDILVIGQEPVQPLAILTARPIGVMQMFDQEEEDDKIIAVHEHDPAYNHLRDISELPVHTLNELQRFFEDYKTLELKKVRIERFRGRADALEIIQKSYVLYDETFFRGGERRVPEVAEEEPVGRTPSKQARMAAAKRAAAHLATQDGNPHR
jgi:inorganic pyrophosphatase